MPSGCLVGQSNPYGIDYWQMFSMSSLFPFHKSSIYLFLFYHFFELIRYYVP